MVTEPYCLATELVQRPMDRRGPQPLANSTRKVPGLCAGHPRWFPMEPRHRPARGTAAPAHLRRAVVEGAGPGGRPRAACTSTSRAGRSGPRGGREQDGAVGGCGRGFVTFTSNGPLPPVGADNGCPVALAQEEHRGLCGCRGLERTDGGSLQEGCDEGDEPAYAGTENPTVATDPTAIRPKLVRPTRRRPPAAPGGCPGRPAAPGPRRGRRRHRGGPARPPRASWRRRGRRSGRRGGRCRRRRCRLR